MKRVLFLVFLLLNISSLYSNESVLIIKDYTGTILLSNKNDIHFQTGDNPDYSKLEFDDSKWRHVSIPSTLHADKIQNWNNVGWFRIPVQFPDKLPLQAIGINLGIISDCDQTFFNGTLIGETGNFDGNEHAYDITRIYEIPTTLIKPSEINVISIRVKTHFDYEIGPVRGELCIDNYRLLLKKYYATQYSQLFFVFFSFILGIFFLILFFRNRKTTSFLFFSLFILCHSIFLLLNLDIRLDIIPNFTLLKKIEQITIYAIFTLAILFFINYFRSKRKYIGYIFCLNNVIAALLILFTKEPQFWDRINIVFFQYTWILQIIFIGIILFIKSRSRKDARIMLLSFSVFAFTIVLDILIKRNIVQSQFIMLFGDFTSLGNLFFVSGFTLVLVNNFIKMSHRYKLNATKLKLMVKELETANHDIDLAYYEAINRLSFIAEYRDTDTGFHVRRVGLFVKLICEKMGIDSDKVEKYQYASLMHDVGKVGIPDRILFKDGPLNDEEWKIMLEHSAIGARIFKDTKSEILNLACDIALTHHEKYDGSGYPLGLEGENIPICGRVTILADIYDALRSARPYKESFSHEKTKDIILSEDGRVNRNQFDPRIVEIFEKYHDEFDQIYIENREDNCEE